MTTTPVERPERREPCEVRRASLELQGYRRGPPETRWSEANKEAFLKAVRDGKGLVVFHHASSAFTKPELGRV